MKKFYQLLVSAILLLMVTGAFAQNSFAPIAGLHKTAKIANVLKGSGSAKKAEGTATNFLIDYVAGDGAINSLATFYYWTPPAYFNMRYKLADTVTSPLSSATANTDLINYVTVTYDTLWDAYSKGFVSPVLKSITDSVYVDTIWAYMAYHNTSKLTDTLIFQVCGVNAKGLPTATQYGADTVLIDTTSLQYNVLDSLQLVEIIPASPISIPRKATHGWNFCINMKNYGSKKDTVGVWYVSQGSTCTPSGAVTSAYTSIGVVDGRAPHVNSFYNGEYWINDAKNGGNGKAIWAPNISGLYAGKDVNSAGVGFYDQIYSGCTDTAYFPAQDLEIFASISIGKPIITGISELANNGFDVAQNAPNPFNKNSQISYTLSKESDVMFNVYDLTGRKLVESNYSNVASGQHVINLSANQFTPGIYFYSVKVNGNVVTKRMVITQ
ncbi:MAG TPA: T9SS type A sorting domain-containing protein [Bacteroidia bacterium]|nr:T9SS type A sorting domain-containing protein [Bacteroidia bacterium]